VIDPGFARRIQRGVGETRVGTGACARGRRRADRKILRRVISAGGKVKIKWEGRLSADAGPPVSSEDVST
jgi:hypothetical protein